MRSLIAAVTHKPDEFSGSTFAAPVSQVRVTGDATFIAAVAGLSPMLAWKARDSADPAVQQVEDRDTGELTDNYALYLGAAERGGQGKIASALLGTNKENDRKLLEALDDL